MTPTGPSNSLSSTVSMYARLAIVCAALVALSNVAQAAKCSDHILSLKAGTFDDESSSRYDSTACSAVFSTFQRHVPHVHTLINDHIAQSFIYSVMSSHFETDAENRLGFGKYLDNLADSMWNDAVELVKYAGKRGAGVAPLSGDEGTGLRIQDLTVGIKPWTEIEALGLALDHHHTLSNKIHQLHGTTKDASFGHFLENTFVHQHVERIRQLSGYQSVLVPMVLEKDSQDLATYLFDQTLA